MTAYLLQITCYQQYRYPILLDIFSLLVIVKKIVEYVIDVICPKGKVPNLEDMYVVLDNFTKSNKYFLNLLKLCDAVMKSYNVYNFHCKPLAARQHLSPHNCHQLLFITDMGQF